MWEPARHDLNGFKAVTANICHDCGGPLRGDNGSFFERMDEWHGRAYAAAICKQCKDAAKEREAADNVIPSRRPRRRGKKGK